MLETNEGTDAAIEAAARRNGEEKERGKGKRGEREGKEFEGVVEMYAGLKLDYSGNTKAIAERLRLEYEIASSEKNKIIGKTQSVIQGINELKVVSDNYVRDTVERQEDIVRETEKLCNENNKFIKDLKKNIEYQEELIEFMKRLASVEIIEVSPCIKFRFYMMKDEHVFVLEDHGDCFTYTPITYTHSNQEIPEYLKESITFDKAQTPKLFLAILQCMSNAT